MKRYSGEDLFRVYAQKFTTDYHLASCRFRWQQAGTIDLLILPNGPKTDIRFICRALHSIQLLKGKIEGQPWTNPTWGYLLPVGFAPGVVADWSHLMKASDLAASFLPHAGDLDYPANLAQNGIGYYVPPIENGTILMETFQASGKTQQTIKYQGWVQPLWHGGSASSLNYDAGLFIPYVILQANRIDSNQSTILSGSSFVPIVESNIGPEQPSWLFGRMDLGRPTGWSMVSAAITLPFRFNHIKSKFGIQDVSHEYATTDFDPLGGEEGMPPPYPLFGFDEEGGEIGLIKMLNSSSVGGPLVYRLGQPFPAAIMEDVAMVTQEEDFYGEVPRPSYIETAVDYSIFGQTP